MRVHFNKWPLAAVSALPLWLSLSPALPEKIPAHMQERGSAPSAGSFRENPKDGLKYAWIPPGTFKMGCSPKDEECYDWEKPAHKVTLSSGFWIGQTEVTVAAYKNFVAAAARRMPAPPSFNAGWANENLPMTEVSWNDSRDFCGWAGGRLPTEAEWEYAARGGDGAARYGPLEEVAWFADNSGQQPLDSAKIFRLDGEHYVTRVRANGSTAHPAGEKRANGFGLYDSLGNVWEWVSDWYDEHYYRHSPSRDPAGPREGEDRVLRGGSWLAYPRIVRVSFRYWHAPDTRNGYVGFRCAGMLGTP